MTLTRIVGVIGLAGLSTAGLSLAQEPAHHFNIQFDYRYDSTGFFDKTERRELLEAAARMWEKRIQDNFAPVPAGTRISVLNPRTQREEMVLLQQEIDDLVVFVGTNSGMGSRMAVAGPTTRWYQQLDREFPADARMRIEGRDFEPWAGFLAINPDPEIPFFFDTTPDTDWDIPPNSYESYDFLGLVMHELGHVLGVGTSNAFRNLSSLQSLQGLSLKMDATGSALLVTTQYSLFMGPRARSVNGGQSVTLSADLGHLRTRLTVAGQQDLMDADLNRTRQLPTALDLAILEDIGYEVPQEYFNLGMQIDSDDLRASL